MPVFTACRRQFQRLWYGLKELGLVWETQWLRHTAFTIFVKFYTRWWGDQLCVLYYKTAFRLVFDVMLKIIVKSVKGKISNISSYSKNQTIFVKWDVASNSKRSVNCPKIYWNLSNSYDLNRAEFYSINYSIL